MRCCRAACPTLWWKGCWETCRRRPAGTLGEAWKHQSDVCREGEEGQAEAARVAAECETPRMLLGWARAGLQLTVRLQCLRTARDQWHGTCDGSRKLTAFVSCPV